MLVANAIAWIPHLKMAEADRLDPAFRRADIDQWYGAVGTLTGLDADRFAARVRDGMWTYHEALGWLRWPFSPFFRLTDTGQQWGLFAVVTEAPDELVIEVRRDMDWETLYRRLDPEHDWRDPQLKYRRIRGVWDGVKTEEPKGTYKRFSTWIAEEIFREQPDVDRVRVVLERRKLTWPWEPVATEVTRRADRYHKRENQE